MVFVGFCENVVGEAAPEALISIREIDERHYRTMTTVNVLLSAAIGIAVFVGAHRIAGWFGEPGLASILRWMSVLPAISAFAAAPIAATKRDMQFQPLALRSIGSLFVGGIVVWCLPWRGPASGRWSGRPSSPGWLRRSCFGTPCLSNSDWISSRHFRELTHFAAPTLVSRFLTWSCNQIPRLMLDCIGGRRISGCSALRPGWATF